MTNLPIEAKLTDETRDRTASQDTMAEECANAERATEWPTVSVIIPVYNDLVRLRSCLARLMEQDYPRDRYEVIVVDNASNDDVASALEEFPNTVLLYEGTPGSYAARNKAISWVTSEVLAFTDSDCLPDVNWIKAGVSKLRSEPQCGLVAGRIDLFFADPDAPTAVELYESIKAFDQEGYANHKHFGATANVFTWRRLMDEVGVFDQTRKSGGDAEWGKRVFKADYRVVYSADALVLHPARRSFGELFRKKSRVVWSGGKERTRIKTILGGYLRALTPPLQDVALAWRDQRLAGAKRKCQFLSVLLFVRGIRLYEITRQVLGGKQQR